MRARSDCSSCVRTDVASQRQTMAPRVTGTVVKIPVPATALGRSSYGTCMRSARASGVGVRADGSARVKNRRTPIGKFALQSRADSGAMAAPR